MTQGEKIGTKGRVFRSAVCVSRRTQSLLTGEHSRNVCCSRNTHLEIRHYICHDMREALAPSYATPAPPFQITDETIWLAGK
jgi:hypothetical protein